MHIIKPNIEESATNANTNTLRHAHLSYGFIDGSEGRLFVVVVNPSVSMQYVNAIFFSGGTVAAVDTMIWTIIPLTRKLQQALWGWRCTKINNLLDK